VNGNRLFGGITAVLFAVLVVVLSVAVSIPLAAIYGALREAFGERAGVATLVLVGLVCIAFVVGWMMADDG
jgi:hypothetical protein